MKTSAPDDDEKEEIEIDGIKKIKANLSKEEVFKLINEKIIYPGNPPQKGISGKNYSAQYWELGIKFLYWDQECTKVFTMWYYCEICGKYLQKKKKLSEGTTGFKSHAESHKKEVVYMITASELQLFAENATAFGSTYGGIKKEKFLFPEPNNW